MNGIEATRRIKTTLPSVQIVMLSAAMLSLTSTYAGGLLPSALAGGARELRRRQFGPEYFYVNGEL